MTYREQVLEAARTVEEAIDALNMVPRNYGGHLSKEGTSTIDGVPRTHALHEDGRVLRVIVRMSHKAIAVRYRGGPVFVVPSYRLLD